MEGYFTNTSRFDRPKRAEHEIFHLTMLAETERGLPQPHQGHEQRVPRRLLLQAAQRLGAARAPPRGHHRDDGLPRRARVAADPAGRRGRRARAAAARFQDIFGREHFFVELQDHGIDDDAKVIRPLLDIARKLDAPLLATNDSHYTHKEDAEAHDALLCVQTGALQSDANRFKFDGDDFYIKSAAEMRDLFREAPDACDNTLLIAERADVEIEFGQGDPAVVPGARRATTRTRTCASSRWKARRSATATTPALHVLERIEYELDVIKSMGFSAYFLVVWDLVRYAKSRGIRVGPGPGSAAGSCVAYCLRIVDIDPIKYDLLFERFLNPGRKQMPDIDMDFDSRYRGEMIRYAAQKYGHDHVAQIITFSTIKARAAVRDAARVLGYPYAVGDKIAKLMPPLIMGRDTPLHACFEKQDKYADGYKMASELRAALRRRPRRAARRSTSPAGSKGCAARTASTRPRSSSPASRSPSTCRSSASPSRARRSRKRRSSRSTRCTASRELGLLKMDFLGLRNLDVMEITLDLIEQSTGDAPDIDDVAARRPEDVRAAAPGPTRSACSSSKAARCARCSARSRRRRSRTCARRARAVPARVRWRRTGTTSTRTARTAASRSVYDHPDLEEILAPTYGLMIYQEQLMRVSQKLAGYTLEEADNLRKATGKKIRDADREGAVEVRRRLRRATATAASSPRATSTRSSRSPTTRSTSRTPSATASSRTKPRG